LSLRGFVAALLRQQYVAEFLCYSDPQGLNLENLTEAITTHAEIADLRADFTGLAEGVILESRIEKGRG
jgi:translation initiation factor IF-2